MQTTSALEIIRYMSRINLSLVSAIVLVGCQGVTLPALVGAIIAGLTVRALAQEANARVALAEDRKIEVSCWFMNVRYARWRKS